MSQRKPGSPEANTNEGMDIRQIGNIDDLVIEEIRETEEMEWLDSDFEEPEFYDDELEEDDYIEKEAVCGKGCTREAMEQLKREVRLQGNGKNARRAAGNRSFTAWVKKKDVPERILLSAGALLFVFTIVTCTMYVNAQRVARQVASFEEIDSQMKEIGVIGESGLLAMADAQKDKAALEEATLESMEQEGQTGQAEYEEKELDTANSIKVEMHLSSIQKDLKIKFVNQKTGKLIPNIPFQVSVATAENKSYVLKDEDMDGIIYQTGVAPGKCTVTLEETEAEGMEISTGSASVEVKDKIEYKKVDVADEVKTEAEVNAAVEDTGKKNTAQESKLQDTVEWTASTKTPVEGEGSSGNTEGYEEVPKDKITDPMTLAKTQESVNARGIEGAVADAEVVAVAAFPAEAAQTAARDRGSNTQEEVRLSAAPIWQEAKSEESSKGIQSMELSEGGNMQLLAIAALGQMQSEAPQQPESGDGSQPESGAGSQAGNDSTQQPEGGSVSQPEGGAAQQPEGGSGSQPESGAAQQPEGGSGSQPEGENGSQPEGGSGSQSESGAAQQPEGGNGSQPEGGSGSQSESGAAQQPEGESGSQPGGGAASQPEGGAENQAGNGTAQQPGNESQNQPQAPQEIKVSLDHASLELKVGESFILRAVTDPAGNHAVWASTNTKVITVQDGIVTAVAPGKADITITTATGNQAVCSVTVIERKEPATIALSQSEAKIMVGKSLKLEAKVTGVADSALSWRSDNEAVATVAEDGTVTGISVGAAVITAVSKADSSLTASCSVTVKSNPETDKTTKLKDNDGNQLYVKDAEGGFREAVYADYYTADKFYKKSEETEYKYTGWQTIDGKTYYFDANGNKVTGEQVIQGAKYVFDSEGVLSTSSGTMGIDVSKWNGSIDWKAVKNSGVSYVIIRCGYRGSTTGALIEDPKFRANIQGAAAAGLKVGIYFFTQAVNEVEAVEEASMVLGLIAGYPISYPVFLDVEASGGRADSINKATRTAVCRAFCQTIQNAGYTAGIYANSTWLRTHIDTGSLTNFKIWLAQYAAAPTYNATRYDIWQYSAKGSVAGISGHVDLNISYLH